MSADAPCLPRFLAIDGSWGLRDALWSCFVLFDGSVKLREMARKRESLWAAYSFSKLLLPVAMVAGPNEMHQYGGRLKAGVNWEVSAILPVLLLYFILPVVGWVVSLP